MYRDVGVDEELKLIADDLLDVGLRGDMRDTRIAVLTDEEGKGDLGNTEVIDRILKELRARAQQEIPVDVEKLIEASGRLLAWMVVNDCIDGVEHFPVWSEALDEDAEVLWLERAVTHNDGPPFAPTRAWPSKLQEFADLFPRSRTLAESYFGCLPRIEQWERLAADGLVSTDVILLDQRSHNFQECPPDEPLTDEDEHVSACPIDVVDVAYFVKDRIGVMARVPDSPKRAVLLWRFLTEYLIPRDMESVVVAKADCQCGQTHEYYGAVWLKPLMQNKWVPLRGKKRAHANAESLAQLFASDESIGLSVVDNAGALRLLTALGVTRLDMTMESLAVTDEKKYRLDADLARILIATGGNLEPVSTFVEDLQSDGGLLDHLDERRRRVRTTRLNQELGAAVERLVKVTLEAEGFDVQRTGIGSDYEIEYDVLDDAGREELAIEVTHEDGRKWLVEVKATRGRDVRMTLAQARTAIKKGERFLLCVVPVDAGVAEPQADQVRTAMRFVKGIGQHLGSLCDELDDLEERRLAATEAESADGVRLEVAGGRARICVDDALWGDAISLENLACMLGCSNA